MRRVIFISMLVILSVLLAACGGAATPAETTSSKQVNIKVETIPSPAVKGDVELILTVTDANGNPIEGAKVDVGADHTDMTSMGMSGQATDQGGGKYSIKANFSDPGDWKLTVTVVKDSPDYKEEFEFKIQ